MKIQNDNIQNQINNIEITSDTLSSRGGLALICRYIDRIGIGSYLEDHLGHLRKSSKGKGMWEHIRQILASFIEGSDTSMTGFDRRKESPEYAAILERKTLELISSDSMRRFFRKFTGFSYTLFRPLLHHLFLWRLQIEQPSHIILYIDTMVLDNDDALKREGVKPTYKPVKGFQPLQIHWKNYMVDMLFRSGEKHSNHGNDVKKSVKKLVELVRTQYREDVPIILCSDSGFLSEENFAFFEEVLRIQYICMGRCYQDLFMAMEDLDVSTLPLVRKGKTVWQYYDFGSRLKSWKRFRRTIFTALSCDDDQYVIPGLVTDSFIYTNIGTDNELDEQLRTSGNDHLLDGAEIVRCAHRNGEAELNHRSIKEFMGTEHLPFKRFGMNGAYYYLMAIGHFLTEAFRYDVAGDVIPTRCYAKTFRRTILDFAAKIIRTAGQVILKVTRTVWNTIKLDLLWKKCQQPPPLPQL